MGDLAGRDAHLSAHVFARASERFGLGGIVSIVLSGFVFVLSRPVFVSWCLYEGRDDVR